MSFDHWLARWDLVADGAPLITHSSHLLAVRRRADGAPAILKLPQEAEEKLGGILMVWWGGDGAARVLAHDDGALLLERAIGTRSLALMAIAGGASDDDASRILCATAARLHAPRGAPPPTLIPLARWFADLAPAAARYGGILQRSDAIARELLAAPDDVCTLHGDLHHDNVLDGGARGWLAIDPKRLLGDRGFDFANILCNPEHAVATAPGRLERQIAVIAEAAHLDRARLVHWVTAYAGLSAAWILDDGNEYDAALPLAIAERAAALI